VYRDGRIETIEYTWIVLGEISWQKVDDQPDRWWVDVRPLIAPKMYPTTTKLYGDVGLPQEELSNEEIALKLAREFCEAVLAKDYTKAGKLMGGVQAEEIRQNMTDNCKLLRVVSIGLPRLHENEPDHFRVPVKVEVEIDGKKEVIEEEFDVEPVEGRPGWWKIEG
jgi:hypothetical protein